MPFFALFCLIFGSIIIIYPQLIAYIIGYFFVFIGINSLVFAWMTRRRNASSANNSWSFGGYEIIKKRK